MTKTQLARREFLERAGKAGIALGGAALLAPPGKLLKLINGDEPGPHGELFKDILKRAPVARYWSSTATGDLSCSSCHVAPPAGKTAKHHLKHPVIKCFLCAHGCVIREGERGRCRDRINFNGKLYSLVYGRPIAQHVDPIEKKPFYNFLPGSEAYSIATSGCPLRCKFCQNWEISQAKPEDYAVRYTPPEVIVRRAKGRLAPVIAFTYNEPTTFTEYLTDIARAAKKYRIRSVLVSCGFMQEKPLAEMIEVLDAIKIDLKGFSPEFYRNISHAELQPVLRSIKQVAKAGRHLEIVNLVIPTLNDSQEMLTELSKWVVGELGPDVPVHFTRFHPDYRLMNLPPTPLTTLHRARETAMKAGMHYAYVGNYPGDPGNKTYCPKCGKVVIDRVGFFVKAIHMKDGKCAYCGTPIAGVWK